MLIRWIWLIWSPSLLAIEIHSISVPSPATWLGLSLWGWVVLAVVLILLTVVIIWLCFFCARLRKDREKLQAIWRNIPDVVVEVDHNGTILALNRTLSPDVSINEIVGTSSYQYLTETGKTYFRKHLGLALSSGRPSEYELELTLSAQQTFIHNRIVPISSYRAIVITTDITRFKDAQRVLQEGKQQSERILNSKAQFLMNVAQEMRSPINIMQDTIRALASTTTSLEMQNIHTLQASTEHLSQIVQDMSLLAQSKKGEIRLESVNTSLWHILDDLEALYSPQALQNQINLIIEHEPLPHNIQTDAFRLRQVLYNLMSCHLGIGTKGQLDFHICQTELANEPVIQFTFKNTVNESTAANWVAFFNQGIEDNLLAGFDAANVAAVQICHSLVSHLQGMMGAKELDQGHIEQWFILPLQWVHTQEWMPLFKSQPVHLAIKNQNILRWFKVFFESLHLPVEVLEDVERCPKGTSLLVSDYLQDDHCQWLWWVGPDYELSVSHGVLLNQPYRRESLFYRLMDYQGTGAKAVNIRNFGRILLVEDNLNNQLVIKRTLEKLGYDVIVASNGKEGVAQYMAESVDCIIMDIQMPVMDGIEATKEIRKSDKPYTPIIALTANTQKEIEEACFAAGMDSFLTKPISRQAIKSTVEAFLGKHDSGSQAQSRS